MIRGDTWIAVVYVGALSFAARMVSAPVVTTEQPLLEIVLQGLIAGGAGVVASWIMEWAQRKWKKLAALPADIKTYLALGISGVIGVLCYLGQVAMLYAPMPLDARGWIEALFLSAASAALANKAAHSFFVQRKNR